MNAIELRQLAKKKADERDTLLGKEGLLSVEDKTLIESLETEVNEYLQRAIKLEEAGTNKSAGTVLPFGGSRIEVGRDLEAEKPFASLGEQMLACLEVQRNNGSIVDKRLLHINRTQFATGASESVPADGGFLVQKDFASEIYKNITSGGEVLSRVNKKTISGNANGMILNAINETDRANGSRWGGVRAYWANEAASVTASKPTFRRMEMTLNKVFALYYATDEVLADAGMLGQEATEAFEGELRFKVEDAIINGDGAGKPLGTLSSSALVSVTKETGQAAATVKYENIVKMYSRLYAPFRNNAVWFINQEVEPQLELMSLTVGTGGGPVMLPPGGASAAPYATIKGKPVIPIEFCAALGTVGDIIFVDLSQYKLIEKGGIQSAFSIHVQFIYDELVFRFIWRVDGQPLWASVLTPFKGTSSTLSPYVALATRA